MWIHFDRGEDKVAQKRLAGVLSRTSRALHDDRAVALVGGLHDRLDLLEIIDVECGYTVTMLGSVVQQLTHRNKGHRPLSLVNQSECVRQRMTPLEPLPPPVWALL